MADAYASQTPYNYAFNSPAVLNDPLGDDPRWGLYTRDEWNASGGYFGAPRGGDQASWMHGGGGRVNTAAELSWSMNFNSGARIWSPWGGDYRYTDKSGTMHFGGAWLDLNSYEGSQLYANQYGVNSKVEIDWGGVSFTDGFANGFMFNSIKASLWREFYTDNVGRLQGLPDRIGRDLRSSYLSRVRANTPQPMLSWAQDMKANGASVRPGARFWVTNQNVNISMRGLGMGSTIGLAMTTVPRVYNSYQSEGLVGVANETSTIMGGIMGAATAMELVAPYALATANPWTAGIIFIGAGIVGGFAGEEAVRGMLSIIK